MVLIWAEPPTSSVRSAAEEEIVKFGVGIVSVIFVELVTVPDVPRIFIGKVPGVAVLATLNISRVVLEFRLARAEVTPAGSPDTARPTFPENPPRSTTLRSIDELHPGCPARTVNTLGEAERVKLPSEIVSAMVADPFAVPDVPVTVAM